MREKGLKLPTAPDATLRTVWLRGTGSPSTFFSCRSRFIVSFASWTPPRLNRPDFSGDETVSYAIARTKYGMRSENMPDQDLAPDQPSLAVRLEAPLCLLEKERSKAESATWDGTFPTLALFCAQPAQLSLLSQFSTTRNAWSSCIVPCQWHGNIVTTMVLSEWSISAIVSLILHAEMPCAQSAAPCHPLRYMNSLFSSRVFCKYSHQCRCPGALRQWTLHGTCWQSITRAVAHWQAQIQCHHGM